MSGDLTPLASAAFWTHALAAVGFAVLLLWRLRAGVTRRDQFLLLAAYTITAAWAWLIAIEGPTAPLPVLAETVRNLLWVVILYNLSGAASAKGEAAARGLRLVLGAEALVIGLELILGLFALTASMTPELTRAFEETSRLLRVVMAAGALIIIHNVYAQAAPSSRGSIKLAMFALAATWGYDLNL